MEHLLSSLSEAKNTIEAFLADDSQIEQTQKAINLLVDTFKSGNKVLSCGNGGSMCDAIHFAEELSGKFRKERDALAALAISDPGHISCVANDYGYEFVFSRMVEAIGQKGDTLVGISTSGNSKNIINAVEAAKKRGMNVIILTGKDGGKLKPVADIPIVVPSPTTDRIQEIHIKIIHCFIEGVERTLFPQNYEA